MERKTTAAERRMALLVLRAQSGDREAMDRVLEAHQKPLFRYLVRMLRDHEDAEDALQATLLQVAKKLRWLREPTLFRSWAFRIASRIAFRTIKARQRNQERTNLQLMDEFPHHETDEADKNELIEKIPDWLDSLTEKGREAMILHYLEGFTAEQVAEILDIPVGTVKSRVSYSLACIRKQVSNKKGSTSWTKED